MPPADEIREAILAADLTSRAAEQPMQPGSIYVPHSYSQALRLDATFVVGGCGSGKSVLLSALSDPLLRVRLESVEPVLTRTDVRIGYERWPRTPAQPDHETLTKLLGTSSPFQPIDVWRTIMHRMFLQPFGPSTYAPLGSWPMAVDWTRNHSQQVTIDIERVQERYRRSGRHVLVVFDDTDSIVRDRRLSDVIVRDLVIAALFVRSYSNLHMKVLLRDDQFERVVASLPPTWRPLIPRADLTWAPPDLHGLLWQRLGNAPDAAGATIRALTRGVLPFPAYSHTGGVWNLAQPLNSDETLQRYLFGALAGQTMAATPRRGTAWNRGVPYTWIHSHLTDGRRRTSPRSFLTAIDSAALDSWRRHDDVPLPRALHSDSIRKGVLTASIQAADDIAENHPWVPTIIKPLTDHHTPIREDQLIAIWQHALPGGPPEAQFGRSTGPRPLLPHVSSSWNAPIQELAGIGVLEYRRDGRIDLPCLYRAGFR
ncbi:hypothetical protein GCM10009785_28030 [Brooklawnia cerclae]|uniref:AAA+ ATPase domain-containing protein n=1 Tax=Brooklawnia cerclae TaxID=349934 RepID=A0ABX0SEW4_9ACTN|nr:hypothetical protein [Brooklawnia cerclae]NIH56904.1 hypothetical protein [Brooklawnia cerclae]